MTETSTTVTVFATPAELGETLAREIANGISDAAASGRQYVLGCPGGRSPRPIYAALAAEISRRALNLDHLVIAMMDEYAVKEASEYHNVDPSVNHSCARFGMEEIVGPLQTSSTGTPRLWIPDARDPQQHEDRIAAVGIDLFILASGSGDGHVAFNSPGTPVDARSRVVKLPDSTRRDNLRTHPEFGTVDHVPQYGVTVGTGTIVDYSAHAVLIAHGIEKQVAAAHLLDSTTYDPDWPATVLHSCRSAALYLDVTAAPSESRTK